MKNIELKVKVPSLEVVLERTKLSAVSNEGVLTQTDTYFTQKWGG